ncbi:hypothetical protein Agub_g14851, partial [Astrephomene gubernaculifera]
PLFVLSYCCQPGKLRHALHVPALSVRLLPLRVALSEPFLWRLVGWGEALGSAGGGGGGGAVQSRSPASPASPDLPLLLDVLSLEEVRLRVSFRPDARSRPRWAAGSGLVRLGLDLACLEDLPLELPGTELEYVRMPRSQLLGQLAARVQERIFSIALAVLRNYGLVGGLSKVLAVSSAGVAQLA